MKQGVAVGAFIQNSKKEFLVVKRSDSDEYMAGKWELPGGGIEDEEPQEGLTREVKEETGLDILALKPLSVDAYIYDKGLEPIQRIEITFLCSIKATEKIHLSPEHSAYQWITPDGVNEFDFSDYMLNVIKKSLEALEQ